MHAIAATIIKHATLAGETAADVEYDSLTPETARKLLASGRDIVPDYAREAAEVIVCAAFSERYSRQDVRDTRIATLATQAWAEAFRAAWPAEDVVTLAAQDDILATLARIRAERDASGATDTFADHRATYEDETEEELFGG